MQHNYDHMERNSQVNTIVSHVGIRMMHVNKVKSHVDMIYMYLACRGEEVCHPIELFDMCLNRNLVFYLTKRKFKRFTNHK